MSAILKIYDILLDIKRATTNNKIEVVEGDNGNVFRIFLTDNGEPVDIEGCRVVAVFSSGDGTAEQDTSDTPFGEYTLTFNGNEWVINSLRTVDDLALCGITLTGGTPVLDDTVTVTYDEDGATAVTSVTGATVAVDRTTFARSLASVMVGGEDNNEIDILVRSGSYSSSGVNECEIQIYSGDDDVLVTTAKFNFQSRRSSLNDETIRSEDKFPILISLIAQANDALARAYKFTNVNASATDLAPHSSATANVTVGEDSVTFVFGIPLPNGIVSVTKSGTGAPGTKDTYTITFSDNTTFSFEVYNGNDGQGTPGSSLPKALGTANAGSAVAYSREDHIHPMPTPADVGAVPTARTVNGQALSSDVALDADDVPTDTVGVSVQDALDDLDDSKAETATYTATIGTTWDGADAVHEATGAIVEFVAEESMALVDLSADINAVQNLNGYNNPWPAGGGKNKFDVSKMVNTSDITINNGVISVTGNVKNSGKKLSELADLTVGETYILTANTTGTEKIIYLYGTGANVSWTFGTSKTITQEMLNALVMFYGGANTTSQISNFMIRLSSITDATYAPYSNICPISGWSNVNVYREAQYDAGATPYATINLNGTVYGGSLDVTNGVLTVTHGFITLVGGNEATYSNNGHTINSTRCIVTISGKANGVDNMTSNRFAYANSGDYYGRMLGRAASNNVVEFYLPPSVSTNVTDQKAWFADNPTEVCFELATPQTVQLTAEQVNTLVGQNVIWADSGDVDVQYKVTSDPVPYSQVVSVSGLLATDNPIVDIVPSDTYATAETQLEAWGSIYRIVAGAGQITVYATEETSSSIPIQIKCVR